MIEIPRERLRRLTHLHPAPAPGPQVVGFVSLTGRGTAFVDREPDPRVMVAIAGGDVEIVGDCGVLDPPQLGELGLWGLISAPSPARRALRAAYSELRDWPRRIASLPGDVSLVVPRTSEYRVRGLRGSDAEAATQFCQEESWVWNQFPDAGAAASSGIVRGAFARETLIGIALPFTWSEHFEDIAVATEPGFRGRGVATACAAAVAQDVRDRGRVPSWTTGTENAGSWRVAQKLGFRGAREVVMFDVPRSAGDE